MKGYQKCLLYALSFAVSLTALSTVFSNSVFAYDPSDISNYYGAYNQTDSVGIERKDYYGLQNCPLIDTTTDWSSYLQDDSILYYNSGTNHTQEAQDSMQQSFQTALNNGSWGVSEQRVISNTSTQYDQSVIVYWSENSQLALEYFSEGPYTFGGIEQMLSEVRILPQQDLRMAYITFNNGNLGGSPNCNLMVMDYDYTNYSGAMPISTNDAPYRNGHHLKSLFFNTTNVQYPSDYTGTEIPDSSNPTVKLTPEVDYMVNNMNLKSTLIQRLDEIEGNPYEVKWELKNSSGDILKTEFQDPYEIFEHDFKQYGDYKLLISYSHPGIPYAPWEDTEVQTRTLNIKIDGSSYNTDTTELECNENGECSTPSPYEDCSTYGTDLIGGFNCALTNFGVWLEITIRNLFGGIGSSLQSAMNNMKDFFMQKLGFLAYPPVFLTDLLTAMYYVQYSVPSCNTGYTVNFGNFFTKPAKIDFCALNKISPDLHNITLQTIRGLTFLLLIYMLWRKFQQVVESQNPKNGQWT